MDNKHYFIAALGQINGIKDDLLLIASNQPKYIDSKNVLLCTFTSFLSINEMIEIIDKKEGRVYFISEVNDSTFSYFIPNSDHEDFLFGEYFKSQGQEDVEGENEEIEDIEHEVIDENVEKTTMSILELIDKGYENLTDEEKEFLNKNS